MDTYKGFAKLYDLFMAQSGIDYDGWANYIERIFFRTRRKPKLILELGCGTGSITDRLFKKGYDMIGIDNSLEMLAEAKNKNKKILYLHQDMRKFELYGTVDAVISICDSINYILSHRGLEACFRLVENYLNPGGLFIFDINTFHKYKNVLGNKSFSCVTNNSAYIWDNHFYEEERLNEYNLTFFARNSGKELYQRFEEVHYQRSYNHKLILQLLKNVGLSVLYIFDDKCFKPPKTNSERIFFVACKSKKM